MKYKDVPLWLLSVLLVTLSPMLHQRDDVLLSSSFYNFLWLRHLFAGIVPRQQSESILQQQKLLKVHVSSSVLLGFVRLLIQKYNNKTREKRVCNQEKEFFIQWNRFSFLIQTKRQIMNSKYPFRERKYVEFTFLLTYSFLKIRKVFILPMDQMSPYHRENNLPNRQSDIMLHLFAEHFDAILRNNILVEKQD